MHSSVALQAAPVARQWDDRLLDTRAPKPDDADPHGWSFDGRGLWIAYPHPINLIYCAVAPLALMPSMPRKLFIQTHGCQMNEYDSARLADVLHASAGLELTQRAEDADVLLLNTCSIREKAQEKVFSQLGRWRALKLENPDLVIGVGGCVASQEARPFVRVHPMSTSCSAPRRCIGCPKCSRTSRSVILPRWTCHSRRSRNSIACRHPGPMDRPPSCP